MSLRLGLLGLSSFIVLLGAAGLPSDAHACGGCFHEEDLPDNETTVVTGHRMTVAISPDHTVLWDQVEYAGNPADFAWVLPIRQGAYLELGTDAFFEILETATSTTVREPRQNCGGGTFGGNDFGGGDGSSSGCCGSSFDSASASGGEFSGSGGGSNGTDEPPAVEVVHQETVGPYETVTLSASVPGALPGWLTDHGYAIDSEIEPLIEDYVAEGFDFIALRLAPGAGVNQMSPVRVVSPGAVPTLPLRMVAAGTGAEVAITLFVISEGRWQADNFDNLMLPANFLTWDFATASSNYSTLREELLLAQSGRVWLTTYARRGSLLEPVINPTASGANVAYIAGGATATTIAEAYVTQGYQNGESDPSVGSARCIDTMLGYAGSDARVVDTCAPSGGGGDGGAGGAAGGGGGMGGGDVGGMGGGAVGGAGGGGGFTGGAGGAGGAIPEQCGEVGDGEIDARDFACGPLDDLAVAMIGLHPRDVWLTRLEANLPRAALDQDLNLAAADSQDEVENWLIPTKAENNPCPLAEDQTSLIPPRPPIDPGDWRRRRDLMAIGALLALAGLVSARRRKVRRVQTA